MAASIALEYKKARRLYISDVQSPTAVVTLFHGGGWFAGDPNQFDRQRPFYETRRIAVASVEYSTRSRHGTMVYEAIQDALDAAAFVSKSFRGTPLFFGGASAGGLLAIHCAAEFPIQGLILYNPVLDLSSEGFSSKAVPPGGDTRISPLHMSLGKLPPMLIFHGENDTVVPIAISRRFAEQAASKGSNIVLRERPKAKHGFANNEPALSETTLDAVSFVERILHRGN
jgi:acetyl esterase/lipase